MWRIHSIVASFVFALSFATGLISEAEFLLPPCVTVRSPVN